MKTKLTFPARLEVALLKWLPKVKHANRARYFRQFWEWYLNLDKQTKSLDLHLLTSARLRSLKLRFGSTFSDWRLSEAEFHHLRSVFFMWRRMDLMPKRSVAGKKGVVVREANKAARKSSRKKKNP